MAGFELLIDDPRVEASVSDVGERSAPACRAAFFERERQQPQLGNAAGQRLADRLVEREVLAAGEHVQAVGADGIGRFVEIGEE